MRRRLFLAALIAAVPGGALASGKKKEEGEGDASPFIGLPTMTATVIRPSGGRGVLTVQTILHVPAPTQRETARRSIPRLVDAYVTALQGWSYRMTPGAAPNVDTLAQVLQRETDRLLGPGARLLLGGVMAT